MKITRHARLAASVTGLALLLSACGGGGGKDNGVASLVDGSAAPASESAADDKGTTEEETLAWVQCMREQGLDIADPTVDADGNLVLGGPRPGGNPGGGTTGSSDAPRFDRDAFSKATEKCGNPPQTAGGFSQEDRQAMQDSLLEMAQCLRDAGFDVADPDFSDQGPGGAPTSDSGSGTASRPRGPFGDLDMNDATVQAAFTACQAEVGTTFPGGRGAPAGGGGNS